MQSIEISAIQPADYSLAAALFVNDYNQLRAKIPILPATMASKDHLAAMLSGLFNQCRGLAARQGGELVGYLGWYNASHFRGTSRRGAYVPEYGHAAMMQVMPQVYRALYQEAARIWTTAGAQLHAITVLAHHQPEREFWSWNGFGMLVVDAIRPVQPLEHQPASDLTIRKASLSDADILHELDVEHCRHYTQPPVFMSPEQASPCSPREWQDFLSQPENSAWIALEGDTPAGFIRFDAHENGGSAILEGDFTVFISGAYVRPAARARGLASAILNAALQDYAAKGYLRCTLDFESVNLHASAFWLRYFQPVAYSLLRIPEWIPDPA